MMSHNPHNEEDLMRIYGLDEKLATAAEPKQTVLVKANSKFMKDFRSFVNNLARNDKEVENDITAYELGLVTMSETIEAILMAEGRTR